MDFSRVNVSPSLARSAVFGQGMLNSQKEPAVAPRSGHWSDGTFRHYLALHFLLYKCAPPYT